MVYIIFHNQTDAMSCRNLLTATQIDCAVVKSPRLSSSGSCAWAVRIPEGQQIRARQICMVEEISPCAWHSERKGGVQ